MNPEHRSQGTLRYLKMTVKYFRLVFSCILEDHIVSFQNLSLGISNLRYKNYTFYPCSINHVLNFLYFMILCYLGALQTWGRTAPLRVSRFLEIANNLSVGMPFICKPTNPESIPPPASFYQALMLRILSLCSKSLQGQLLDS